MLAEVFDVLTCPTTACPHGPIWFEVLESWIAHFGAAFALVRFLPPPFGLICVVLLICKEPTFDFARDPTLATLGDSAGDIAAMWLGRWIAGSSQFRTPALFNRLARLWPRKKQS